MHNFSDYFPIWSKLKDDEKSLLLNSAVYKCIPKGKVLHYGSDCVGLFLIEKGQLRAYTMSEDGKEITLFRLLDRDMCLFSASCIISEIQFEVTVETEKDTYLWVIRPEVYQSLMKESVEVANYTNALLASRMSEVMWIVDQIMFKSFDSRLAAFLLSESNLEQSEVLHITHEAIAKHIGSAREVVSRMLKYFANDGIVKLARGDIEIINRKKLEELAK